LLIFGYGPFPELGLKGAAYATAISRGMTMILAFLILRYREKLIRLDIPDWKTLYGCWKAILYIGIPSGLSRLIIPVMTGIITALLAQYGESAVAAFGVGTRVEFLAMSLLIAISASIGPFTGQNFGAYNFSRIKEGMRVSTLFAIVWGLLLAGVFFYFGESIASFFTSDKEVIRNTALYLKILPIGFGFQGVVQIVNSNLNTLNKPLHASGLILVQMFGLALPLIFIGKEFFEMKGIFYGWMVAYIIGGILSYFADRKIVNQISDRFDTQTK
jgi:Na+-driven multidrug efflux pump